MKTILLLIAISITLFSFTCCEKKQIKPASGVEHASPVYGNWDVFAVKISGQATYSPPQEPIAVHFTDDEVVEWGPYTWTETALNVTFPNAEASILYERHGSLLILTFPTGTTWKLVKT